MCKILRRLFGVPCMILVVAALAAAGLWWYAGRVVRERASRAAEAFALSVLSENSPIAELATRKVVWKVVQVVSSLSKDVVRETVFTVKAGYDLTAATLVVSDVSKTVELRLPLPKVMSIDHFLQRTSVERKTLVERIFGSNGEDGAADREDIVRLAADCAKYNLLSMADLRESIEKTLAARLRECGGYRLVLEDGCDVPVRDMFNDYFEEKCLAFRLP